MYNKPSLHPAGLLGAVQSLTTLPQEQTSAAAHLKKHCPEANKPNIIE